MNKIRIEIEKKDIELNHIQIEAIATKKDNPVLTSDYVEGEGSKHWNLTFRTGTVSIVQDNTGLVEIYLRLTKPENKFSFNDFTDFISWMHERTLGNRLQDITIRSFDISCNLNKLRTSGVNELLVKSLIGVWSGITVIPK